MTAKNADEAVANANRYTSYDVGMCLKWVRGPCWEIGSLYGSAIDAWHGAAHKHPGDRNPPKGAACFYSGGQYGHIVIWRGGDMRSTDCTSSGRVGAAALNWPEVNWNDKYLGWTSDLNGVDLPIGSGTPDEGDDEMPQYDHAATSKAQKIKADEWQAITWMNVASGPAFKEGDVAVALGGRKYDAVLHVTYDAPKGATIRLQCVEYESGELKETNPQVEMIATGGNTYASHVQIGAVKEGRRLRFRTTCSQAATLTKADATVLSWA